MELRDDGAGRVNDVAQSALVAESVDVDHFIDDHVIDVLRTRSCHTTASNNRNVRARVLGR